MNELHPAHAGDGEPLRLAVVGAYGNGKTTLVSALAQAFGVPRVHGTPMRDPDGGPPKSLEECSEIEVIELVTRRLIERVTAEERNPKGFISDGSSLHEFVYATVRFALGTHPRSADTLPSHLRADSERGAILERLGEVVRRRTHQAYNLVIHVPAEHPLGSSEHAINDQFRVLADRLVLANLAELGLPVHVLCGTPQERLDTAIQLVTSPSEGPSIGTTTFGAGIPRNRSPLQGAPPPPGPAPGA